MDLEETSCPLASVHQKLPQMSSIWRAHRRALCGPTLHSGDSSGYKRHGVISVAWVRPIGSDAEEVVDEIFLDRRPLIITQSLSVSFKPLLPWVAQPPSFLPIPLGSLIKMPLMG